jgi:hypothetical protein
LMRLIVKYRDPDRCTRTFELAWSHAQLEYRYRYSNRCCIPLRRTRQSFAVPEHSVAGAGERLRRSMLGQSRLWAGISGDLPLAAVSLTIVRAGLVRELLVYTCQRLRSEGRSGHSESGAGELRSAATAMLRLVEAHSLHTGGSAGGCPSKSDHISEEDRILS